LVSKYERPGSTTVSRSSPAFGELVQRIVNGRQGHRDPRDHGFPVQLFGSDVPVAVFQKELRQGKPLSHRSQTGLAQPPDGSGLRKAGMPEE